MKRVQSTFNRGIDINAINERTGFTALMLATVFDHKSRGAIMEFLIKNGAVLNAVGSTKVDRCTALHVAAQKGHYDAIEMLLKHGADPTKLDDKCCSPSQERFDSRKQMTLTSHIQIEQGINLCLPAGIRPWKTTSPLAMFRETSIQRG